MRSKMRRPSKVEESSEESDLLSGLAAGDQRSLAALYDRYGNAALGLAFKVCGNRAIAEDIVQEAFLALWQRPESFDSKRGSAGSFLMGIVHHKAVDAVRREAAVHRREENFAVELQESSEDEVVEAAWVAMRKSKVLAALRQLSDVQREALELAYLQGLTYSDVAAKLNIPLGTAKTRMRDGMIRLRTLLAQSEVTGSYDS
ncbi:MAG TPA: sigma-70 family RNA polymerase sigma factor [Actinomycetota bacterium]|nr:sigma-70 family RNA polymerase sigma factor [Actinomycetota bacterium]